MKFYLGTTEPAWLPRTRVPLFISRRRFARRKSLPRAIGNWALDSGGFTELKLFGAWRTEPKRYADEAACYQSEVGNLDFAAIQDWMCEPSMLGLTGKTVQEHQELSTQSYLDLMALAPGVPWIPVLQGWKPADYVNHAELYEKAGVRLDALSTVGIGSVCRRQATREAFDIFADLLCLKLRLHGFGLKRGFLEKAFGSGLVSFDSMAWSLNARKRGAGLEGCTHKSCANCMKYAVLWRESVISLGKRPRQMLMHLAKG